MQITTLVLASWRLRTVNTWSLAVNAKSALAQAKASSSIFIGINSNYSMAYPWGFFIRCCRDETHGVAFLGLLAPCNEPLTRVTLFFLCLSPRNYVRPPVWKPVHVQRGCVPCEPSPNHKPQLCLDCSTCRDGLCQLHVRIYTEPWAENHSGDNETNQPARTVW